jgi:uncharacterized protein
MPARMYTKATMWNWITKIWLIWIVFCGCNANERYKSQTLQQQQDRNTSFLNPVTSPFTESERSNFKGLQFAAVNLDYRTDALLTWLPFPDYVSMQQTGGDEIIYMHTAVVSFNLFYSAYTLNGYQTQTMREKRILFIPFADATNGVTTYGGGRYIDLAYVDQKKEVVLDFNLCYAPLCAYVSRFSCPKIPKENQLPIQIEAGEIGIH